MIDYPLSLTEITSIRNRFFSALGSHRTTTGIGKVDRMDGFARDYSVMIETTTVR